MVMRPANLTGVRAKLRRANVHLDSLNHELARLTQERSDTSFIEHGRDGEWYTLFVNPIPKFPIELSLIAGDIFTNLRDTLDHIVWQLILREGNEPKQTNDFPIFTSESDFINKIKFPSKRAEKRSSLYGLPVDGDAWAIIEQAQPWFRAKADGSEPKHDQLMLMEMLRWTPDNIHPIAMRLPVQSAISHEKPTELVRLLFPPDINVRVYMDRSFPISPAFGDKNTWTAGLGTFHWRVSEIVDQISALPGVYG